MELAELQRRLTVFPRLRYFQEPTPLQPLEHLTKELLGPRILIKRDDGIGPEPGGNKGRCLEFLMADVLAKEKRKVVTFGGLQSNHTRMTAAACAALGLEAHVIHFERRPERLSGNLLLTHLFGANLHFVPFGGGGEAGLTVDWTNRLVRLVSLAVVGPGSYFIPVGGHSALGALGYVSFTCELVAQLSALNVNLADVTLVTAVGSGCTLAGLMAASSLLEMPYRLLGIDVGRLWRNFPISIARLAERVCRQLGGDARFAPDEVPIIEDTYVGPGYARPTAESQAAIQRLARTEGILLDPVYTGKAFAGLLDQVDRFDENETVIFLHTGGIPGLWAQDESV